MDPFLFEGGGELADRAIIEQGRDRGHEICVSSWLRRRPQRLLRRLGIHRSLRVDWSADLFVLANIRNNGPRRDLIPDKIVNRALDSGRAVVVSDAWVDACVLDMPCGGNRQECDPRCDRTWANAFYGRAAGVIFVSPMQARMIGCVLDVPFSRHVLLSRPFLDIATFRPLGLERDIDVLYVGRINKAKGYDELIARFGSRLTLVGPNELGHPPEAEWLGEVPHSDLPHIMNRARYFAHLPRWHEPMGRTPVEAALCGCELILNERVGVATYPEADWQDPHTISRNGIRLWEDLELVAQDL